MSGRSKIINFENAILNFVNRKISFVRLTDIHWFVRDEFDFYPTTHKFRHRKSGKCGKGLDTFLKLIQAK